MWFTSNVPDDTCRDLAFQDAFVLKQSDRVLSFIVYTCIDGSIQITLMGTRPEAIGKGLGSILLQGFCAHIKGMGFGRIVAYTVPPDRKPAYLPTLRFYEKNGFKVARRFDELWESGALQLVKELGAEVEPRAMCTTRSGTRNNSGR